MAGLGSFFHFFVFGVGRGHLGLFFRFSVAVEIRSGVGGHPLARLAPFCPPPARASPAGPGLRREEEEEGFWACSIPFATLLM